MEATDLNPILNVSDFAATVAWFGRLGWDRAWDWGDPPTFGAVRSGHCEIFLCQGAQGALGGVWLSIWVDDVDVLHQRCQEQGIKVARPPADEPWGVREMHVVHPDGHTFRMSQPVPHSHDHDHGHDHDHPHDHDHDHLH
jgi:catechol 2,3-dioxygenase-like lactoylglutathione lyase family enzyme